jgi:DNA-binding IclR family transcriptional regulator
LRGKGRNVGRFLAAVDPERPISAIMRDLGIDRTHWGRITQRLIRYGLIERVGRGRYRRTALGEGEVHAG